MKLADLVDDEIVVTDGESKADVIAGCAAVAMKRASLFGRGPVVHDLREALRIWGYLSVDPPPELVAARKPMFAEVAHAHHYVERRMIADAVPAAVLHQPHDAITAACAADWRSLLDLTGVS